MAHHIHTQGKAYGDRSNDGAPSEDGQAAVCLSELVGFSSTWLTTATCHQQALQPMKQPHPCLLPNSPLGLMTSNGKISRFRGNSITDCKTHTLAGWHW